MPNPQFEQYKCILREALAAQPDRSDLTPLATQAAQELNISDNSARALRANITIAANRLVEKAGLTGVLSSQQAIAVATWYQNSFLTAAPDQAIGEIAQMLELSEHAVAKLLASAYPNKFLTIQPKQLDEEPASTRRGSEIDYGTATKRAWRQDFIKFIEECFPQAVRGDLRVVCMPSRNPRNEIELYTAIGIKPGNIYCIEGDLKVIEEFKRNCKLLNVNPIVGRIEKMMPTIAGPVHVVNLDMLGGWSTTCAQALAQIELAEHAVVIVNRMAARESSKVQKLIRHDFLANSPEFTQEAKAAFDGLCKEFDVEQNPENWRHVITAWDGRVEKIHTGAETPQLHELRECLIDSEIARLPGIESSDRLAKTKKLRDLIPELAPKVGALHIMLTASASNTLLTSLVSLLQNYPHAARFRTAVELPKLIGDCLVERPHILRCEKAQYQSDSGTKGLTYYTTLVQLETPRRVYSDVSAVAEHLAAYLVQAASDYLVHKATNVETNYLTFLSDRKGQIVDPRSAPRPSECFFNVRRKGGDQLCRIRLDRLIIAIGAYRAGVQKYLSYSSLQEIPRRIINSQR